MTLIITPILTISTPKTSKTVRNSSAYQKSSIGNSICRSKVSIKGMESVLNHIAIQNNFSYDMYLLSPSPRPSACCQFFYSAATIPVKGEKTPSKLVPNGLHIEDCNVIPWELRIYGIFCGLIQDALGWLGIRAELSPGTFIPRIGMTTHATKHQLGHKEQLIWLWAWSPESDYLGWHLPVTLPSDPSQGLVLSEILTFIYKNEGNNCT